MSESRQFQSYEQADEPQKDTQQEMPHGRIDPNKPTMHIVVDPSAPNMPKAQRMINWMENMKDAFKSQFNMIFTPSGVDIAISTMPVTKIDLSKAEDVPAIFQQLVECMNQYKAEKEDHGNGGT